MIILTIDQGNTKCKVAVFRSDGSGKDTLIEYASFGGMPEIEDVAEIIERLDVTAAIYCSVGHVDVRFVETLRGLIPEELLILTHRTPMPIDIDYKTPESLGLDRVVAAVGASVVAPGRSAVVVDAGTALTEDLLICSPGSRPSFRGGRISPGVAMRFRALSEFTCRLPLVDCEGETPVAGRSTEESIRSGVVRGMSAEIKGVSEEYSALEVAAPGGSALVVTGGDAPLLMRYLDGEAIHEPHLIDIGLCEVLKYNYSLSREDL